MTEDERKAWYKGYLDYLARRNIGDVRPTDVEFEKARQMRQLTMVRRTPTTAPDVQGTAEATARATVEALRGEIGTRRADSRPSGTGGGGAKRTRKATGAASVSLPKRRAIAEAWNDYVADCRGVRRASMRGFLDERGSEEIAEALDGGRRGRTFQILAVVNDEKGLKAVLDVCRKARMETGTEEFQTFRFRSRWCGRDA